MRHAGSDGGGGVSQADLMQSVALRRRAREAHDEWKAHHRSLAARLHSRPAYEPGRYRPAVARVEGLLVLAIHDDETPMREVVAVDKYNPKDLD